MINLLTTYYRNSIQKSAGKITRDRKTNDFFLTKHDEEIKSETC